ncbi:Highly reducing polyketide synthase sorA [Fusarium oxysporum f. sp. albedinis]|nr:Highly reducing polyketide synthase sorA [Fusarium oxysporum f. sp. albedinis]
MPYLHLNLSTKLGSDSILLQVYLRSRLSSVKREPRRMRHQSHPPYATLIRLIETRTYIRSEIFIFT